MGSEERVRAGRVGERLRASREAAGVSLEEISAQTRVPTRHLVAIETGRLEKLPAVPYSAGFVRAYAQALGLEGAGFARDFRGEIDKAEARRERVETPSFVPAEAVRTPPPLLAILAAVAALLLTLGAGLWWSGALSGGKPDARIATAGTPRPPVAGPAVAPRKSIEAKAKHKPRKAIKAADDEPRIKAAKSSRLAAAPKPPPTAVPHLRRPRTVQATEPAAIVPAPRAAPSAVAPATGAPAAGPSAPATLPAPGNGA